MPPSLTLFDPVSKVRGVGPRYLKSLEKLNIKTVKDLLWHFPFRYEDFSQIKKIQDLKTNETCSLVCSIKKINLHRVPGKKLIIIEAKVSDETGELTVIWFNQMFLIKNLPPGTTLVLSGETKTRGKKLVLVNPSYEIISQAKISQNYLQELKHTGRLIPIYSETAGISSRIFRSLIKSLLTNPNLNLTEYLPPFLLRNLNLLPLKEALNQIHFPDSLELAEKAKTRFIFESLFLSQIYLLKLKKQLNSLPYPKIKLDLDLLKNFTKQLPFELTQAQKKSLWEIARNLNQKPMNRLLAGDVGSGKTIVALGAALLVVNSNYQVAFLAPTELLAQQHFETFKTYAYSFAPRLALLTSKESKIIDQGLAGQISKTALNKIISSSLPIIVIGTHALLQKNIRFEKLGLVIVDEQHRFGVAQRKKLMAANSQTKEIPHLLSLTATPIPRTLALVFYGDLDLSLLDELPPLRKPVITKIVPPQEQSKVYQFIREEVLKGRQAFVICPRIEESHLLPHELKAKNLLSLAEKLNYEVKAATKEYQKLSQEIFPDLKVGLLHGKMKSEDKERVMKEFQQNKISILVATSIVEVGIDIPNATIIVIEGAEYFGLAQLHQFRGRVGRSQYQSYCFLFTESSSSALIKRLTALVKYQDGFKLAEIDLSLRGPGEFLGTKQSGVPDLLMTSLINKEMIAQAHQAAQQVLILDSTLKKWPSLKRAFQYFLLEARRNLN